MFFKIAIVFLVLIPSFLSYPQEYWKVIQTPVDIRFNSIFALDTANIWIAGDNGTIIYTSDKGETWDIQTTGNNSRIYDVHFINENEGWAVEWKTDLPPYGTFILKTTDGGENWESSLFRNEDSFLYTIYFLDSLNGFAGGDPDFVYSDDGGENWYSVEIYDSVGAYLPVYKFNFYSPQYGYAVGGAIDIIGVIWRTQDFGQTWRPFAIGPDPLYDIAIFDSLNIYALAGDLERLYEIGIIRSADAGETWSYDEIERYGNVTGFSFRTPAEAWASLWYDNNILVTKDSGSTWNYYVLQDSVPTFDVIFVDSITGFMISDEGRVIVYVPDKPNNVYNIDDELTGEFYLYQNYPNPFNAQTEIKYFLKNESYIRLSLFNLLGQEVLSLDEEWKNKGTHSIKVDLVNVPAGVYFYQLKINNDSESRSDTKKMVLLK